MNKLQPSNPYIHLQRNRKIFTFFVTATYSLVPPNVNTLPICNHDSTTGVGVQLELWAAEKDKQRGLS